jgi:hypothetical protein
MLLFNEAINNAGLVEIPLKGRRFTWSNMQDTPLLQSLDWFFSSLAWTVNFPNTLATPLALTTSDHVPCVVSIETSIPKSEIFRVENSWMDMEGFLPMVELNWTHSIHYSDATKRITAKFKILRKCLKTWSKNLFPLKETIADLNALISLLDALENFRDLSVLESNFRKAMKKHLATKLAQQLAYWKQRGKIKWVTLGDENSRFFHSMASTQKRRNHVASLVNSAGDTASAHTAKASLILQAFKDRLGYVDTTVPLHNMP